MLFLELSDHYEFLLISSHNFFFCLTLFSQAELDFFFPFLYNPGFSALFLYVGCSVCLECCLFGAWLSGYFHGTILQPSLCVNLQLLHVTSFCFLLLLALMTVGNYLFWLLIYFFSLLLLGCIRSTKSPIFLDYLLL